MTTKLWYSRGVSRIESIMGDVWIKSEEVSGTKSRGKLGKGLIVAPLTNTMLPACLYSSRMSSNVYTCFVEHDIMLLNIMHLYVFKSLDIVFSKCPTTAVVVMSRPSALFLL